MPLELKMTVNLPRTDFPMKANLPQREPQILENWEKTDIYQRIRDSRRGAPAYVLHDGPPYANGALHLGHALNKCLKDFIVKSKNMAGFDAPYVPGWDCHGLPIEIKVDQQLGRKKLEMNPSEVRLACRRYADKFLNLQREQFKRIGVFGRWDRPYSTMTPEYESVVLATFYQFLENGFVYKGLRSVYWCIHDQTALAEAEVEYENHTSTTVWVKYAMSDDPAMLDPALHGRKVFTIIWTTTPWTLPASMAVAFHPDENYVALEGGTPEEIYLVAEKLAPVVAEKIGIGSTAEGLTKPRILARFPGRKLERVNFRHPFLPRNILGVLADYVTMDTGTGVVHTAPSHGAEDFVTGLKYNLDATTRVDEAGILREGLPEYDGKQVFEANAPIVELLRQRGVLLHAENLEHSYPHCWRCHNPIIFRATEQWFISMDTAMPSGTLRTRALDEIKKVKWDPAWGEDRISNMIATRPDWCISRQRIWGVPIAVFLCESCGKPLLDPVINRQVEEFFTRLGADAWYSPEADGLLPAGANCTRCSGTKFKKEMDILDVWFESGSSYLALRAAEPEYPPASDLYLEGGDQHRGWFHSSLLCTVGVEGHAPYRHVATVGWTLDESGQAMSKSRGNDVDPVDIADRMGGEIVRLWVASVDFREDVVGSERLMQAVAENYRKIRNNLFKNALGNLYDFDPSRNGLPFEKLDPLDQYMLRRTSAMATDVVRWYEEFAFHKIYQRVLNFCVVDLSAFYFDVLKDRLYTYGPNSAGRRAAQTTIWRILEASVRLLAPILSFTCEEVWGYLPKVPGRPASVHLAQFPTREEILGSADVPENPRDLDDWTTLVGVREQVLKALEEARNAKQIGKSLEAEVMISTSDPVYSVLARHADQLRYLFIVSAVTLEEKTAGNGTGSVAVHVSKADGRKCERCWNYSIRVGEYRSYPTVCERCSAVLKELEGGSATSPES
ncbi:MAG TPA: isoleucine--tRNA ligase [Terriglobales bacterium]|nr:isoleucine--tRNA ligase [Terriglobales bacterium]